MQMMKIFPQHTSTINYCLHYIPVSSCEAERSFSALRRIKSYLRSTMSSERFIALIHLHSDVDIDIDEVCEAFNISKHNRKMFQSCILYQ